MSETILKSTQFIGIDYSRLITTITSLSNFPYVATEDCWCVFYFYKDTSSPSQILINNTSVATFIGGYHSPIIPLKKDKQLR